MRVKGKKLQGKYGVKKDQRDFDFSPNSLIHNVSR